MERLSKYKKYFIKTILFIFFMETFINVSNFVFNRLNIEVGSIFDFLSIGVVVIVGVPLTLIIIEFLFKE